jgi:hypothetical protein
MATRYTLDEARELLSDAQQYGNIFDLVASGLTWWLEKYADTRTAWYHGISITCWSGWTRLVTIRTVTTV